MTQVLERRRQLQGYEVYVVEQWATSRSHPTFAITTYTGDPQHSIIVGVLSVPTDETTWSSRLRVYFKALNQYHARRRETPLGILMVTNLTAFPSSLQLIRVPEGDIRSHRNDFFVNEDLKRLNCAGRVGLTIAHPAGATIAKFHQLYRTSDKNDLYASVIELVKLCQSALMLFDKLEIDYADGLLCDLTERGVNDWWLEMGSTYYNIEPHDGILGPTTVAGLLGLLMGARNRLHAVGAPVAKDAFDVEAMKRGIGSFQKQQRIQRTRRLDRRTLEKLHRTTQKTADHAGWTVPKAVKNTVAELSGKGGEMVMDAVGRRDKAGIADIETCDMERFVQLVYGERAKWLWYGKPLKNRTTKDAVGTTARVGSGLSEKEERQEMSGRVLTFREGDSGGYTWTARKSIPDALGLGKTQTWDEEVAAPIDQDGGTEEESGITGVLKRTSGFKEAKSGLGRFKGAVGLGHHRATSSKDNSPQTPKSPQSPAEPRSPVDDSTAIGNGKEQGRRPLVRRVHSSPSSAGSPKSPVQGRQFEAIPEQAYAASYREQPRHSKESSRPPSYMTKDDEEGEDGNEIVSETASTSARTIEPSIAGSVYNDIELNEVLPTGPETEQDVGRLLRRTISLSHFITTNVQARSTNAYPRHLSFSLAEDSVLTWSSVVSTTVDAYLDSPAAQLADEEYFTAESKHLRHLLNALSSETVSFTSSQLDTLATLLSKLDADHETLDSLYRPRADELQALQAAAESSTRSEKERLEEAGKEIEMLAARLEYEINGLKGRVEDVSAGVGDFEKGVGRVEERVGELERDERGRDESGWRCVVS